MSVHHEHHETKPLHDQPDDWHDHTKDVKPTIIHGEVANARMITSVGVVLFLVVVVTCVLIYGFYMWYVTGLLEKREAAKIEVDQRSYRQECLIQLAEGARWIDHDTCTIPLESAKDAVIARYAGRN